MQMDVRRREGNMSGRIHRLNGHKSEQTPGDGEGQESLACIWEEYAEIP